MKGNSILEQVKSISQAFLQGGEHGSNLKKGVQKIAEATGAAALVLDKEGTVKAGYFAVEKIDEHLKKLFDEGSLAGDSGLMTLLRTTETVYNEPYPAKASGKKQKEPAVKDGSLFSVIPIKSGGKSLATLLLAYSGNPLHEDQYIAAEVGAALAGMIFLHDASDKEEEDARNKELAEVAFDSLSYSEVEAIREILKNINNNESIVVASKIADSLGITRSVIVNALRKFESAGIIESRSLGMKGTFIRVKNIHALEIVASRSAKMTMY